MHAKTEKWNLVGLYTCSARMGVVCAGIGVFVEVSTTMLCAMQLSVCHSILRGGNVFFFHAAAEIKDLAGISRAAATLQRLQRCGQPATLQRSAGAQAKQANCKTYRMG